MLALLSNVTTLCFQGCDFLPAQSPSHLGKLPCGSSSTTGGPRLLSQLRALYIGPEDDTEDTFVHLADFVPFFNHPGLKQIKIYCGVLLDGIKSWRLDEPHQLRPSSLSISTLYLPGSFLDQKSLQMLIEACKDLKFPTYRQLDNNIYNTEAGLELHSYLVGHTRDDFYEPLILNPHTFSAAFETCKDTLEILKVTFQGWDGAMLDENTKLPGLRRFSRLTTLNIEARHMSRFRDLPSTLQHLAIQFEGVFHSPANSLPYDLAEFLEDAANSQAAQWPSLRSVLFLGHVEKERLKRDVAFRQAMITGTWMQHNEQESPCCLVWYSGDIQFTIRSRYLHSNGDLRWAIMQEEPSM